MREVRHKHGKYGNEGKCGKRKCSRERKYMGEKGRGMWGITLERAYSTRLWEGKCGTKREVRGIEGSAGGKGGTGMWNETQTKKQWLAGK